MTNTERQKQAIREAHNDYYKASIIEHRLQSICNQLESTMDEIEEKFKNTLDCEAVLETRDFVNKQIAKTRMVMWQKQATIDALENALKSIKD